MFDVLHNQLENRLIKSGSHPRTLGYQKPKDLSHVAKYPLSALPAGTAAPRTPIAIGIDWYSSFDTPVLVHDGKITRYFVGQGNLGTVRGGHCVCLKDGTHSDPISWWSFYDQGQEGACVGFGSSRMMSLLNRERYNARWLWDESKIADEWPDTNPGDDNGTSVHAAADVLRLTGHVPYKRSESTLDYVLRDALQAEPTKGIQAARWATSVDEIRAVLQSPLNDRLQAVPFLNSWGRSYPHVTWLPYTVVEKLITDGGEFLVPTDK